MSTRSPIPESVFLCLILISAIVGTSCERIKNKGKSIANKTEQKIRTKADDVTDKVFPRFDAYKRDTENNKKRFKDFLKVELTNDISNIYCFDDAIGIDADYMFAFNCDSSTVKRILLTNELKRDTSNIGYGFSMQHDFERWDKKKIEKLELYSWTNNDQYFKFFWYDSSEKKAYFFDFDL